MRKARALCTALLEQRRDSPRNGDPPGEAEGEPYDHPCDPLVVHLLPSPRGSGPVLPPAEPARDNERLYYYTTSCRALASTLGPIGAGAWGGVLVDEAGSRSCKLSPRSFPDDEPPTLSFRALLMENGAERLELARA